MPKRLLSVPGKICQKNASAGRLKALYGAQFWRILANGVTFVLIFTPGTFWGSAGVFLGWQHFSLVGGMGASATIIMVLIVGPGGAGRLDRTFIKNVDSIWQFRKKFDHVAEDF